MPRFVLVEGKPGHPVVHPQSTDGKRYVGMRRRRDDVTNVHAEECFQELLQDHLHLRRAIADGSLVLVREIEADDHAKALAQLEPKVAPTAPKPLKGGDK